MIPQVEVESYSNWGVVAEAKTEESIVLVLARNGHIKFYCNKALFGSAGAPTF